MTTYQYSEEQEKKKKRNAILIVAVLLLLVAITSIFIGTLSKYITSTTQSDEAVVAKFGLNVPNSIDLFSDTYTNVTADEAGKNVIAPGTSGSYNFVVNGTSEVAYKVEADISLTYSEDWDEYEPLLFSIDQSVWTDFDVFKTNLTAELSNELLNPNEIYENMQTIYWSWPYSVSPEADISDTAMGKKAATGTAPSVTVDLTVTAVQVD